MATLTIFGIMIAIWIIQMIWNGARAAHRTATKGGNFADNFKSVSGKMGAMEVRTKPFEQQGEDKVSGIEVQVRGLIPVARPTQLMFVTSLLDVTDSGDAKPVISRVDNFQEQGSIAFQFRMDPVQISPNQGFTDWCRVGVILPQILTPPRRGARKLAVLLRLMDVNNPGRVNQGFLDGAGPKPVAERLVDLPWTFADAGYEEATEARAKQRPLFVKLAVAVAMADKTMEESEGKVISAWIQRQVDFVNSDEAKQKTKADCNEALRTSYAAARKGELSLSSICSEIMAVAELSERYGAIELCLDVMAADGKASTEELQVIRKISDVLQLDYAELQRMKDVRLVTIQGGVADDSKESMEELLGIDPAWPKDKTQQFLRDEFKKWNARLTAAKSDDERANIQSRIDLISKARAKYA